MTIHLHKNDLSHDLKIASGIVAIDTEAMGLNIPRDRLCVVQLATGDGDAHLIQMEEGTDYAAPRLRAILEDSAIVKLFHFARFDVAILKHYLGVNITPIYCTKIASKLCRTYTDKHSLKDLCQALLDVTLQKEVRLSDWGQHALTTAQQQYAANDVLYLHALKEQLDALLVREERMYLAQECFAFVNTLTDLDLKGWDHAALFSH